MELPVTTPNAVIEAALAKADEIDDAHKRILDLLKTINGLLFR